jgi:hypothetical protein
VAGNVVRHFAENHKETWKLHRKELKAHIMAMSLARKEDVLAIYPEPYDVREPVAGIAVLDGWSCDQDGCLHISTDDVTLSQHCRVAHGWKTEKGKMWSSCRLQSLFPRPNLK